MLREVGLGQKEGGLDKKAVYLDICFRSFMEFFWVWDSPDVVLADVCDHPDSFFSFRLDPDGSPADGLA